MKNNNLFETGQPVGIYKFTSLPLLKLTQIEELFYYKNMPILLGRILGCDKSTALRLTPQENLLIITINGFTISVSEDDILTEPREKMEYFLKRQEFLTLSKGLEPYNGTLIKKEDGIWYTKL